MNATIVIPQPNKMLTCAPCLGPPVLLCTADQSEGRQAEGQRDVSVSELQCHSHVINDYHGLQSEQ